MGNVKMSDIAKRCGCSVNTVSHALNGKSDISEKTKKFICDTAREMGYIANSSAGALRSGKSRSIAIIVGDISNPHFSIIIKEMESRLREFSYNAIIMNTDEDEEIERAAIISAISKSVDGILICPVQKTKKNIEFLEQSHVPYMLFGRHFSDIDSSFVVCDDENGGFAAAEYLIDKGHRNILFINAPEYISSAADRHMGALRAFEEKGMPKALLRHIVSPTLGGDESMADILRENAECTAIICFSDLIAMQVCYLLKRMGKDVPRDISVVGFDNIASKFYFPLMISSVTSSKTKMSIKAVECMMDIIDGKKNEPHKVILPTKIVERESTSEN